MSSIDRLGAQVQGTGATRSGGRHPQQGPQQSASIEPVVLSDWARWLAASLDTVRNASEVRDRQVADIRQRLRDGSYNVPSRLLARKMLDASHTRA